MGGGGARSALFGVVMSPKGRVPKPKDGCKNLLVVSEKMFFKVWTTIILLSYFGCLVN
jgi:hypothetical protein